ncbi:ATP-binding cassette domain-containing protein, partial [Thiohalobacter sp.]|uniref:ATP-binding cassette domain-containing protein n=1 Tax=Thiohalobacter sp. TaxID=2025948 RepID=UPI002622DF84
MTDPVRVRQLDFHYQDGSPVLRDLSLTVPAGSLFGLLGPNGAGKTTLLMLITGLLPVQTGVVEVLGEPIRGHHPQVLSRIALVPQEYAFYPQLTALENLRFFVRLCPGDGTEAER